MDNFNIDNETMEKIKSLIDEGNLEGAIGQIPPDVIANFSKMMSSNENKIEKKPSEEPTSGASSYTSPQEDTSQYINNQASMNNNHNNTNGLNATRNLNNIDMNTVLQLKALMNTMGNKNFNNQNLMNGLNSSPKNDPMSLITMLMLLIG